MARNKIGLHFKGWEELINNLDRLGGDAAMKKAVEAGLTASKEYVNDQVKKCLEKNKLPAKGKYSDGDTERSLDDNLDVDWDDMTAQMPIGFDMEKSGPVSIFLIYGTPSMKPAKGLKAAIYGSKTKKQIAEIQKAAINEITQDMLGR